MSNLNSLSLQELLTLQTSIAHEISQRRGVEEQNIIGEIKQKAAQLGLSLEDLVAKLQHGSTKAKRTVAAQYRDPATGTEWSGRGRRPRWVEAWLSTGRTLEETRIAG